METSKLLLDTRTQYNGLGKGRLSSAPRIFLFFIIAIECLNVEKHDCYDERLWWWWRCIKPYVVVDDSLVPISLSESLQPLLNFKHVYLQFVYHLRCGWSNKHDGVVVKKWNLIRNMILVGRWLLKKIGFLNDSYIIFFQSSIFLFIHQSRNLL